MGPSSSGAKRVVTKMAVGPSAPPMMPMEEAWAAGKTAAFLTIENGSVLAGDLSRVHTLAEQGVRAITLTWNGENELGSGHTTDHGMSEFGKAAVGIMDVQYDYYNSTMIYRYTKEAIETLNPSPKN